MELYIREKDKEKNIEEYTDKEKLFLIYMLDRNFIKSNFLNFMDKIESNSKFKKVDINNSDRKLLNNKFKKYIENDYTFKYVELLYKFNKLNIKWVKIEEDNMDMYEDRKEVEEDSFFCIYDNYIGENDLNEIGGEFTTGNENFPMNLQEIRPLNDEDIKLLLKIRNEEINEVNIKEITKTVLTEKDYPIFKEFTIEAEKIFTKQKNKENEKDYNFQKEITFQEEVNFIINEKGTQIFIEKEEDLREYITNKLIEDSFKEYEIKDEFLSYTLDCIDLKKDLIFSNNMDISIETTNLSFFELKNNLLGLTKDLTSKIKDSKIKLSF